VKENMSLINAVTVPPSEKTTGTNEVKQESEQININISNQKEKEKIPSPNNVEAPG
jgi:hypothetical protein